MILVGWVITFPVVKLARYRTQRRGTERKHRWRLVLNALAAIIAYNVGWFLGQKTIPMPWAAFTMTLAFGAWLVVGWLFIFGKPSVGWSDWR